MDDLIAEGIVISDRPFSFGGYQAVSCSAEMEQSLYAAVLQDQDPRDWLQS